MSKVQLQGNVSGTGVFTIASPNSNTDRTLTLPDNTGTLLTNGSQPSFASTIGVGGATPANTGAGITFPATANLSSNGNTLDDYEEGTWDCRPSTSDSSVVPLAGWSLGGNVGTYTKVGRVVNLTIYFEWTSTTANTDIAYFILPFPSTGSNTWSAGSVEVSNATFPAGTTYITFRPESSTIFATMKGCGTGTTRVDVRFNNLGSASNGYVIGNITYTTTA